MNKGKGRRKKSMHYKKRQEEELNGRSKIKGKREYIRIYKKNKHQKAYWCISQVSAGLHSIPSTLRVLVLIIT